MVHTFQKKTGIFVWGVFLCLCTCFSFSFATTITVPGDYTTIQAAIDASTDGDEIIVSTGTYVENITTNGKNILLRSSDPTDESIRNSTVIDGNASGCVVTFDGTEQATCILSGFTITNGNGYDGGGIYGHSTLATIQNNTITNNSTYPKGGGLCWCDGTIQNNRITENSAYYGGGLSGCDGTIQNNTIKGNTAGSEGGGLDACNGTIQNNTIIGETRLIVLAADSMSATVPSRIIRLRATTRL